MNLSEFAAAKGFTEQSLREYGLRDGARGVEIPYYDTEGREYPRYRLRFAEGWAWSAGDESTIPYGLHRPIPFDKGYAWIVEGESDSWALWNAGLPALGIPGASNTGCLGVEHVNGSKKLYVVQEPGEAGSRFPHRIAMKLYGDGYEGTVYAVQLTEKDPRALMLAAPEHFTESLREAVRKATIIVRPQSPSPSPEISFTQTQRLDAGQLLDLGDEHIEYLVEGILPKDGVGLVVARQKVGKTVFVTDAALAVARGIPFIGRRCRQGSVIYLSLDEPRSITAARMKAAGLKREDPIQFHLGAAPHDWQTWLYEWVKKDRPALLVVDTIAKLGRPKSMDDYSEVNRITAPLLALRSEFGTAQLWLTHGTKSGEGSAAAMGSIAWTAAVDTTIMLRRNPDGGRTMSTEQRFGDDIEPSILQMNEETFSLELLGEKQIVEQRAAEQKILDRMQPGKFYEKDEIVAFAGKRLVLGRKALGSLLDAGLIIADGSGKRSDPRRYTAGVCHSVNSGHGNGETNSSSPKKPVSMSAIYKDIADRETHLSPNVNFAVPDLGTPQDQAGQGGTPLDMADASDIADRETENTRTADEVDWLAAL